MGQVDAAARARQLLFCDLPLGDEPLDLFEKLGAAPALPAIELEGVSELGRCPRLLSARLQMFIRLPGFHRKPLYLILNLADRALGSFQIGDRAGELLFSEGPQRSFSALVDQVTVSLCDHQKNTH